MPMTDEQLDLLWEQFKTNDDHELAMRACFVFGLLKPGTAVDEKVVEVALIHLATGKAQTAEAYFATTTEETTNDC